MKKINFEEHIVPRPVDDLPDYANAKARQSCADKLSQAFSISEKAARVIADAVVDPTTVRKSIGDPVDPNFEEIPVPGGILKGIRTSVWAFKIVPDPRNPRIRPSRKHPFAVEPGAGEDDSRFRPIPEPRSPGSDQLEPLLAVDVESRHHLKWAAEQATRFVLAENDWTDSIASQGVMEHVWLVPTIYRHMDGSDDALVLNSVEGSSRTTAVHELLDIVSANVPYDDNDGRVRATIKKFNQSHRETKDVQSGIPLRCARLPALIILGFRRNGGSETGFPTAIRSLVALRHVDRPKPWGEGPENEALADEVLDELLRQRLITETDRDYYAGTLSRQEALAAHLSDNPAIRASLILRLFTSREGPVKAAIRSAIASQSTRKNITMKLCDELATSLILRAASDDRSTVERVRRYLRDSFGMASHQQDWKATNRPVELLESEALAEIERWIVAGQKAVDPGPASLELAVRAAYPFIVSGRLVGDLGRKGLQPDHRSPGEVLDAARRTIKGVRQLSRACRLYPSDQAFIAVDELAAPVKAADGQSDQMVSDNYLRGAFPPLGKAPAPAPGDSPLDHLNAGVHQLGDAIERLETAFGAIWAVLSDNGRPIVETYGIESALCASWRHVLTGIQEDLVVHDHTFRRRHGAPKSNVVQEMESVPEDEFDGEEVEA